MYLITGGAGFIGSNLAEEVLRRGHQVRVLDNFSTGKRKNLEIVRQSLDVDGRLQVYEGDLCHYHTVQDAVQGVDFVLHQGALPSVPRSMRDPLVSNEVNVTGTLNLLHAANKAGVKRLVYASSSSVYGNNPILPKVETMCPMPRSPYAVSKLSAEQYCQVFNEMYSLETVALRYFNVFGPRQDLESLYGAVIPKFIAAAIQDEVATVHGDGLQSRDFTYISNVVEANILACEAPEAAGKVLNVSCGERYTLIDLISALESLFSKPIRRQHVEARPGDVKHSQASIEQARMILGYEPIVDFHEGLKRTIDWYSAHIHEF